MALLLFLIPCGSSENKHKFILDQNDIAKNSMGYRSTFRRWVCSRRGFCSKWIIQINGTRIFNYEKYSSSTLVAVICTIVVFSSELTSNTAQTTVILPYSLFGDGVRYRSAYNHDTCYIFGFISIHDAGWNSSKCNRFQQPTA